MTLGPNFLQAICDPKIRTKSVSGRNPSLGGQAHEASWGHLETSFYRVGRILEPQGGGMPMYG